MAIIPDDQEIWYSKYEGGHLVDEDIWHSPNTGVVKYKGLYPPEVVKEIYDLFEKAFFGQSVEDAVIKLSIDTWLEDFEDWFDDEEVEEVQELNVGDVVVLRRIIKPFGLFNHFNPAIITDKFRDPEDNALVLSVDLIYYKGMVDSDGKAVMLGSRTSLTGYEFEEDEKDLHRVELVESLATGRKQISDLFADRVGFSMLCREAVNEYLLTEKLQGKLTAEVFNTKEYDGAKAMDITKKMLGG